MTLYKVLKGSCLSKVLRMTEVWSDERPCYFSDLSNSVLSAISLYKGQYFISSMLNRVKPVVKG